MHCENLTRKWRTERLAPPRTPQRTRREHRAHRGENARARLCVLPGERRVRVKQAERADDEDGLKHVVIPPFGFEHERPKAVAHELRATLAVRRRVA